jgi:hypothetical protein
MKAHRLLALLFVFFILPIKAFALTHWHLPMSHEIKTLRIYNFESQAQSLWISRPINEITGPFEDYYEVPAFGQLELPLVDYRSSSFIHLKAKNQSRFQIQVFTSSQRAFVLPAGWQTKWRVRGRPKGELLISNLAPFEQTVKVNLNGKQSLFALKAFENKKLKMNSTSTYTVEGEARIAVLQISSNISQAAQPHSESSTLSPGPSKDRYFLMSNFEKTQSFVIGVSDPRLLSKINEQLAYPHRFMGRILIGQIDFGSGGINRDFFSQNASPWSWRVSKVLGFAELASQTCDGSPEFLEELLGPWRSNQLSICFWDYQVTRELSTQEVQSGKLN